MKLFRLSVMTINSDGVEVSALPVGTGGVHHLQIPFKQPNPKEEHTSNIFFSRHKFYVILRVIRDGEEPWEHELDQMVCDTVEEGTPEYDETLKLIVNYDKRRASGKPGCMQADMFKLDQELEQAANKASNNSATSSITDKVFKKLVSMALGKQPVPFDLLNMGPDKLDFDKLTRPGNN